MKKAVITIMAAMLVSGCASMKSIDRNYGSTTYHDGINSAEAKRIAKKSLLESKAKGQYMVIGAKVIDSFETYPHPNYWFVSFHRKFYNLIPSNYIVVIDKRTGEIQYSEKRYRTVYPGLRWVFNLKKPDLLWHAPNHAKMTKK